MMSEKKLITSSREIQTILDNIFYSGGVLDLVQADAGEITRNKVQIIHVNLNSLDFSFRPLSSKKPLNFKLNRPVEITNTSGCLKFTTRFREQLLWNQLGFIHFPKVISITNKRENERLNFEKYKLPINFKNFTIFDYSNKHKNVLSELIDLSPSGLALKLAQKEASYFEKFSENDKIIFTLINGYSFSKKATGRLVYMGQIQQIKHDRYFKLGIKFDNSNQYDQFSKLIDNQLYIQKYA